MLVCRCVGVERSLGVTVYFSSVALTPRLDQVLLLTMTLRHADQRHGQTNYTHREAAAADRQFMQLYALLQG